MILALTGLGLTACGGGEDSVTEHGVTVNLPSGWKPVEGFTPVDGWQSAYGDAPQDPKNELRISGDLGQAGSADTALASMRGKALFNGTYGSDFKPQGIDALKVKGADRAVAYRFTAAGADGKGIKGWWFLFSNRESDTTGGVELIGDDISEDTANRVKDSLRYEPQERA